MTENELKKIMLEEENKIIREATIYCGKATLEFSKEHNKLTRLAIRRFYRETIYPHLRELNINAPREYDK